MATVSGCRDSAETTLSIASTLVPHGLVDLLLADGVTTVIEEENHHNATDRFTNSANDALKPPSWVLHGTSAQFTGPLPQRVVIETTFWYDQSLLRKFGGSSSRAKAWLARVAELSKPRLVEPSLNVKMDLKIESVRKSSLTLKADEPNIYKIQGLKSNLNYINSYFCYDLGSGIIGIAFVGTACDKNGFAVNINEYYTERNSELSSARVFVHELGHNIGM